MQKVVIEAEGFEKCIAKLGEVADIGKVARPIMKKGALAIEGDAKILAPRRAWDLPKDPTQQVSGDLRNTISHKVFVKDGEATGIVYAPMEYAIHQEFGTSKMKARPFLRPALRKNKAQIKKALIDALQKKLK